MILAEKDKLLRIIVHAIRHIVICDGADKMVKAHLAYRRTRPLKPRDEIRLAIASPPLRQAVYDRYLQSLPARSICRVGDASTLQRKA